MKLTNLNRFKGQFSGVRQGFPGGWAGKESARNAGDLGSVPGLGRLPWRRERLPTPVFWPGEFHGLCGPWGHKTGQDWETFIFSSIKYIHIAAPPSPSASSCKTKPLSPWDIIHSLQPQTTTVYAFRLCHLADAGELVSVGSRTVSVTGSCRGAWPHGPSLSCTCCNPLPFKAKQHPGVRLERAVLTRSPVNGCFHILAAVNDAAVNTSVQISLQDATFNALG